MPLFSRHVLTSLLGDEEWADLLLSEFRKPYVESLVAAVAAERRQYEIYPESHDVFRAFRETPLDKVKVVVIGQDPYHTPGMATGLAFSVPETQGRPPSLRNIMKEVEDDVGWAEPAPSRDLVRWAEQGVLLLNTSLTVRKGAAESHACLREGAWPQLTREIISRLAMHYAGQKDLFDESKGVRRRLVFLLWGAHARALKPVCDPKIHYVLESAHPSPFSAHRGFFGSKPFSRANELLEGQGLSPIIW